MDKVHIKSLDGVRTIAIILVLLRHAFKTIVEVFPETAELFQFGSYNCLTVFLNGWVGVDLFFVLSGYLIARPFIHDREFKLKNYAMKRILRIVPAYYTVLILCLVGFFPFYMIPNQDSTTLSAIYHFLFLQDVTGSDINVVFWSLGVEEKFYIAAPLFLVFLLSVLRKTSLKLVAIVIAALLLTIMLVRLQIFIQTQSSASYIDFFYNLRSPFYGCMEPILLGVLIAIYEKFGASLSSSKASLIRNTSLIILITLLASHEMMEEITLLDVTIQPLFIALVMAGIVWGTVMEKPENWLSTSTMKYISKLSYALYLVHWPLIPLSITLAKHVHHPASGEIYATLIFLVFYTTLTFIAAITLHYLVERPFLNIKARF